MPELNRRDFLSAAAAATIAASGANAAPPAAKGWIDCHSHIWSRDIKKWPLAAGLTLKDLKPASFTDDELLKMAGENGVNRVVLIQHTVFHRFDNSYMLYAAKRHPGRFSLVTVIDDKDLKGIKQRMLKLRRGGSRGFRIVPKNWHGEGVFKPDQWLASEGMRTMWRVAAESGMAMCPLIHPEYIGSVDKMCRDFPDTNVVIDHFARVGIDGTIRKPDLDRLCALARHRNVYVKVSAYYALGRKQPPYTDLLPMIRRVIDAFGVERLMWGSDAPYQVVAPHTYKASVDLIRNLDSISDSEREWLVRRTAEKVFFSA